MANKNRLIDANAVLKKMQNWNTKERLINCVEDAPTVDAVEVVRCKDCTSYGGTGWCSEYDTCMEENDFCSYGERKHNG